MNHPSATPLFLLVSNHLYDWDSNSAKLRISPTALGGGEKPTDGPQFLPFASPRRKKEQTRLPAMSNPHNGRYQCNADR